MRLLLERAVEMRRRNQLAEIGIALLVLGQQDQPVDRLPRRRCSAGRATASIAPMIGWTPLPMQASLNGMTP